jgi:hypothetical protein
MLRRVCFHEAGAIGVNHASEYGDAAKQDVEPIDEKRRLEGEELSEQARREGQGRHAGKKGEIQPAQIAIRVLQMIEMRLLPDPENAEGHEAGEPRHDPRAESGEPPPKLSLRMDIDAFGNMNVEDQDSHGEGKNAVAQSGDPSDVLRGEAVVDCHGPTFAASMPRVNCAFAARLGDHPYCPI